MALFSLRSSYFWNDLLCYVFLDWLISSFFFWFFLWLFGWNLWGWIKFIFKSGLIINSMFFYGIESCLTLLNFWNLLFLIHWWSPRMFKSFLNKINWTVIRITTNSFKKCSLTLFKHWWNHNILWYSFVLNYFRSTGMFSTMNLSCPITKLTLFLFF